MTIKTINLVLDTADYAEAYLARANDKEFVFSECNKCFIMFQEKFGYVVALGDPVGPIELWEQTINKFIKNGKSFGYQPIFYKADKSVEIIRKKRFVVEKIGEDGVLELSNFSLSGKAMSSLRRKINQSKKSKVICSIVEFNQYPNLYPELEAISDCWLHSKNRLERGFSVGSMSQEYLATQIIGIASHKNKIVAFCTLNATSNKFEASIDLMRYKAHTPIGTMHSLVTTMIQYSCENGFKYFNLCMAPLSGLDNQRSTILNRAMKKVYSDFNHHHGLQGLRRFKEYYKPEWKPKYLATPRKITAYIGALRIYATVRDCK